MLSTLATRHSPKYKDFLLDGIITLHVGRDRKKMEMHKKLLASISPELNKHVNNDMKEGIEGIIRLPDEEEDTLMDFIEWAYTGEYTRKDCTPTSGIGTFAEPGSNPWPSLRKHLQLCVFSDKFNISILKQLAESKFHAEISPIEPKSMRDATGLMMVIDYAFDNLPCSDPVLKYLVQYASWKFELLRGTAELAELLLARPGVLKELLVTLKGSGIKPTSRDPQTHLTWVSKNKRRKGY
ncbi:hypothetical protein HOY80DRAFT_981632 [Tuber brumale]|nr:hypothetical protein HOY80DRAFT_981632 [Tuber brumale]